MNWTLLFITVFAFVMAAQVAAQKSRCYLEKESGRCRARKERVLFNRYYYDKEKKRCRRFIYGGCGGNENNFQTRRECKKACIK
ncbi:hypothetical protein Y032_0558g3411 [Ancylostoma ceylanicum]|uniref:BPTI/Kunitz inhibitor domain-containing protein n=1 Tax=Ancylostoma ceylanicum TaxID=53326 RepID=A0A016WPY5_9BILA|nr:hypothetical protein Y032_0558g3411 [Ancylostoma ceylanicum]